MLRRTKRRRRDCLSSWVPLPFSTSKSFTLSWSLAGPQQIVIDSTGQSTGPSFLPRPAPACDGLLRVVTGRLETPHNLPHLCVQCRQQLRHGATQQLVAVGQDVGQFGLLVRALPDASSTTTSTAKRWTPPLPSFTSLIPTTAKTKRCPPEFFPIPADPSDE